MGSPKYRIWHCHQCGIHGQTIQWAMSPIIGLRWDEEKLIPMLPCKCYLRTEPFELMQWTGWNVDGRDLYEDDILKFYWDAYDGTHESIVTISKDKDKFILDGGSWSTDFPDDFVDVVEYLGNVYENKELLNES